MTKDVEWGCNYPKCQKRATVEHLSYCEHHSKLEDLGRKVSGALEIEVDDDYSSDGYVSLGSKFVDLIIETHKLMPT